jgi:hypothetical protein
MMMAIVPVHCADRSRIAPFSAERDLAERYRGRNIVVLRGVVVRTTKREPGSARSDTVVVVTGTARKAIRRADPKTAATMRAQGPGRRFLPSRGDTRSYAFRFIRDYFGKGRGV